MIKAFFALIILSAIGLGWFFFAESGALTEKEFMLADKKFSIFMPRNHIGKSGNDKFISLGRGKIFSIILVLGERKSAREITCADLRAQIAFRAFNSYLQKELEVCQSVMEEKGFKAVILDTPQLFDEKNRYMLNMGIREDYFVTAEGKDKAKQIFESFRIVE